MSFRLREHFFKMYLGHDLDDEKCGLDEEIGGGSLSQKSANPWTLI